MGAVPARESGQTPGLQARFPSAIVLVPFSFPARPPTSAEDGGAAGAGRPAWRLPCGSVLSSQREAKGPRGGAGGLVPGGGAAHQSQGGGPCGPLPPRPPPPLLSPLPLPAPLSPPPPPRRLCLAAGLSRGGGGGGGSLASFRFPGNRPSPSAAGVGVGRGLQPASRGVGALQLPWERVGCSREGEVLTAEGGDEILREGGVDWLCLDVQTQTQT